MQTLSASLRPLEHVKKATFSTWDIFTAFLSCAAPAQLEWVTVFMHHTIICIAKYNPKSAASNIHAILPQISRRALIIYAVIDKCRSCLIGNGDLYELSSYGFAEAYKTKLVN